MILVEGWISLSEGDIEKVRAAASTVVAKTNAEDGCLSYSYGIDIDNPNLIRISERWRDMDALKAHGAADHMKEWNAALRTITMTGAEVIAYQGEEVAVLVKI